MDSQDLVILLAIANGLLFPGLIAIVRTVTTNGRRLAAIEAKADAFDVAKEVKSVHERVDKVAESSARVEGQLTQVNHSLGIIQQHLLNPGTGKP